MNFQSEKSFEKLRLRVFQPYHQILCLLKHVEENFFQIENQLNIKEVMSKNVYVCSFPIFDIFDIHSIIALKCT